MGKYYETWQNALNQVHNWKPGTNTHQQILQESLILMWKNCNWLKI